MLPPGASKYFPRNACISDQGADATRLLLIESGIVKLSATLWDGRSAVVGVRYAGQLIDDYAYLLECPMPLSAHAATPCQVHVINTAVLRDYARANSEFTRFLNARLAEALRRYDLKLSFFNQLTPEERFRVLVLEIVVQSRAPVERNSYCISMPLNDNEMAGILGISTRHLARVRKAATDHKHLRRAGHCFRVDVNWARSTLQLYSDYFQYVD